MEITPRLNSGRSEPGWCWKIAGEWKMGQETGYFDIVKSKQEN